MIDHTVILLFLLLSIAFANLPWLSDRLFGFFGISEKRGFARWFEWGVYYCLMGVVAAGLESKLLGGREAQGWEFYVITLSLFLVFALPGFIYHYDLKKMLASPRRP